LVDYREFEATHFTAIIAWRDFYAPNYTDVFGGNPRIAPAFGKGKEKKEADKSEDEEQNPPPFNL
jgi:hypothetical protein